WIEPVFEAEPPRPHPAFRLGAFGPGREPLQSLERPVQLAAGGVIRKEPLRGPSRFLAPVNGLAPKFALPRVVGEILCRRWSTPHGRHGSEGVKGAPVEGRPARRAQRAGDGPANDVV